MEQHPQKSPKSHLYKVREWAMLRGFSTFRTKVFFPILFLVLVTVGAMGYLYILRQGEIIEKDLEKRGQSLVTVLAKSLKVGILTRSDEYINEAIKSTVDLEDVLGVRVYDSDGRILRDISKKDRPRRNVNPKREFFGEDLLSRVFHFEGQMDLAAPIYYIESGIGRSGLERYPLETDKRVVIGYVTLSLSTESIASERKSVRNLAAVTALFFCVFGGLIAYYIASIVTLPLSDLVKKIRDMQVHGLLKLPVRDPYEIRELSESFNVMAEALRKKEQELHSMASTLSLTEERERRRISTELHDNIGQTLALSKIKLGMLRESVSDPHLLDKANEIYELIDQTIQYSRLLMFDLSSPVLYALGLVDAVETLAGQIGAKYGLQINWENCGQPLPMDDETRTVLYKAVRELLLNVVKHARAREITVSVRTTSDNTRIRIEDNGVGFDTRGIEHRDRSLSGRFGLLNIRERLKDIKGILVVESSPGQGTIVTIIVPFMSDSHGIV